MKELSPEIKNQLLYILHRGFVEVRQLGGLGKNQQIVDLADALELIPGMINNWRDGDLDKIKSYLTTYQNKYKGEYGYNFLERVEGKEIPEF